MTSSRREFLSTIAAGTALTAQSLAGQATRSKNDARASSHSPLPWPSAFPALRQIINGHPLAYLDSAATTLRPQSVIDALAEYYSTDNANPSRVHSLAARAADRLVLARQMVARFVNAPDPSEIIFVRGTTEGLNLVATAWGGVHLRRGDEVVLSVAEHASNLLPWTRAAERAGAVIRVADVDDEGRLRCHRIMSAATWRTKWISATRSSSAAL